MKKLIAAFLFLVANAAYAQNDREWSTLQIGLATAATAFHIADWGQTRAISESNGRYYESAPITKKIIGTQPSRGDVDAFMVGTYFLFLGAAHFLPEYRTSILGLWAATRLVVIIHNDRIGLHISF